MVAGFTRTVHPHAHTHTYTLTVAQQRHCSSFLKGKDKYNTLGGSSAVRYAKPPSSSRMRYTHTHTHWEAVWVELRSEEVVPPAEDPGFQSFPSQRRRRRKYAWGMMGGELQTAGTSLVHAGCEEQKKGARPNKPRSNATFFDLRIKDVMCARFYIASIGGNPTGKNTFPK